MNNNDIDVLRKKHLEKQQDIRTIVNKELYRNMNGATWNQIKSEYMHYEYINFTFENINHLIFRSFFSLFSDYYKNCLVRKQAMVHFDHAKDEQPMVEGYLNNTPGICMENGRYKISKLFLYQLNLFCRTVHISKVLKFEVLKNGQCSVKTSTSERCETILWFH